MRMNLHILHDALSEYNPLILASDSPELNLEGIRYLPSQEERWSTEYMYAVTTQELISAYYQTDKRSLTFLCQGNVDPSFLTDKGWSAIVILESSNYNEVFDIVQNTFKAYRKWEEKLSEAALSGCSFKAFLDIASAVFHVPIVLINCIGRFVFSAGDLSSNSLDNVWDSLRYKGIFPHDMLNPEERRFLNSNLNNRHDPFTLWVSGRQQENIDVIVPLYNKSTLLCTMVFIGYNTFSKGQLSLMYYLQQRIESIFDKFSDFESLDAASAHGIIDISSESEDPTETIMGLLPERWNGKKQFSLLVIPFERERYSKVFLNDLLSPLYAILTAPAAFIHNNELIFVEPDALDSTAKLSKIRKALYNNGLVAGVSNCFHDVSFIRWAYQQCKMALDLHSTAGNAGSLYFFQEQYCQCLYKILTHTAIPESLCNFSLLQLAQKKEKRVMIAIHDLRIFLAAGGNISQAADLLQIHRNTLKTRLEKLSRLIGVEFSALNEQEFISLYLTCLIIDEQTN